MNFTRYLIVGLIISLLNIYAAQAETLSFDNVLDTAIKNSYDLQISKLNVDISKAGVKQARSEYFPTISAGYNAGYQRDLTDGNSTITPVGDSILLNNTRYQNSASAGIQYNLYDFGIRGKQLKIAKKDKTQKETGYQIELRELKTKLAETYTKALLNYKEYTANNQLLAMNTELFSMRERLYDAGKDSRTDVLDAALKVARITNKIDEVKTDFRKNLEDLSFYTGKAYNIEGLELLNMDSNGIEPVNFEQKTPKTSPSGTVLQIEATKSDLFNAENLPDYKYYQLEIEKKQEELKILNRQRLPNFKFYTNYYLYGDDKDSYWGTFSEFEQTNLTFRISSNLPVFTGFKNTAQREQKKLEIQKLEVQRDKRVAEIKSEYQKMYSESQNFSSLISNQEKSLTLVKDKIALLDRLNEQKLIDKITYLDQKSGLISQKLELEKAKISNDLNMYKLNVLETTSPPPAVNEKKKKAKPNEEKQCKQD